MSLLPGFDIPQDRPPLASRLAPKLRDLAERGIYFGTSSWKYEGWLGSIYGESRYQTRGKHSKKKFEEECLTEYAETFPTVCGDFAIYQFPSADYWARLFDATPPGFLFGLKVPEDITVATWPTHARYGTRAGRMISVPRRSSRSRAGPFRTRAGGRYHHHPHAIGSSCRSGSNQSSQSVPTGLPRDSHR